MKTNLAQTWSSGRLALTAEFLPPRGGDAAAVRKIAATLPARLDAVVVADNPHEIRGSALACAAVLEGEQRQTVLSMITRDRNRIALESDALGAAMLGIHNMLCLSGEHQSLGINTQAAGAYDIDSVQLVQSLKNGALRGLNGAAMKLEGAPETLVGAAAHPYLRPAALGLLRLRKDVAAGADFVITQAIFDIAGFSEWMEAVRKEGIDKKVAIIASVMPLTSIEQAKNVQVRKTSGLGQAVIDRLEKAADVAKEGIAIAAEMARQVQGVAGVRGIHILSGGCEGSVAAVIQEAGLNQA